AYERGQYATRTPLDDSYRRDLQRIAEAMVDSAIEEARSIAPSVRVRGEATAGGAAACLIRATKGGAMVVVGSRGRGGFAGLLLGSVALPAARPGAGWVVVVRDGADRADGPVVVGVDGGDDSDYALTVAFEEAAKRGVRLVALHAYLPVMRTWGRDLPP